MLKHRMQDDTNSQPNTSSADTSQAVPGPKLTGGQKVIQPLPAFAQELRAQQSAQPEAVGSHNEPTQPTYSTPTPSVNNQMQAGMSASQMGFNHPKSKLFDLNPKKLIIKGIVGIVVLGGIFAALIATNIIALSRFKTIDYINSMGSHYSLTFYTKHTTKKLNTGNTQLVSKVSEDGKFPLTLSIASGDESGYARVKDCASYTKVFDVQNNNLNQKISVCNLPLSQNVPAGVYVAGILYHNQTSIVTISQDLSGTDLSSPSGAQQSLAKFGLDPYPDDITKIIASIRVQ